MRTLVVAPNWVGDAVMATPALRALRKTFPEDRIELLARPSPAAVLAGNPWTDETIELDWKRTPVAEVAAILQARQYDRAVILPHSLRSAWICRKAAIPERVGHARQFRGPLLTRRIPPARTRWGRFRIRWMGTVYLEIAGALGCPIDDDAVELFTTPEEEAGADRVLDEAGIDGTRWAAIIPGASFGSSKCWLPERFAETGIRLREEHGLVPLVLPGPAEREIAAAIRERGGGRVAVAEPGSFPLGTLKGVMKRAALVVSNDTGPSHFAVAWNVPAVILYGPMDPGFSATHQGRTVRLQAGVWCQPCNLRRCPIDRRCMTGIAVDRVMDAVRSLLPQPARFG